MKKFKRFLLLLPLLILAFVCYMTGVERAAMFFLALGVLLELSFWLGLFRLFKSHKPRPLP